MNHNQMLAVLFGLSIAAIFIAGAILGFVAKAYLVG